MRLIGNLIVRLITVSFGFLLAIIAAGIFLSYGFYSEMVFVEPHPDPIQQDFAAMISVIFGIALTSAVGIYAAGVAAIAIAIAELMRWKSLVANLLLGGLCGLVLTTTAMGYEVSPGRLQADDPTLNILLVGSSAGFIAGFVYWLIAGRGAGDWMATGVQSE